MAWDWQKIEQILPQRYPFLFVDKVIDQNSQEGWIKCIKNFTINDYFFKGHFPGNPVVPGVIMIEALAQASILLYALLNPQEAEKKPDYFLGKVEVKFMQVVRPGDTLVLIARKKKVLPTAGIVEVEAVCDNQRAVYGTISFGVKLKQEED